MANLTKNDITNLYLYGQLSTPANLVDANLIRPKDAVTRVTVDVRELMATGAGRFAVGSQFELVKRFFQEKVPPRTYTKTDLLNFFKQSSFKDGSISWNIQQYNYDDGASDFIDRVWVYNSMEFQIANDVEFIVDKDLAIALFPYL
ncbi:MAG: hypothetical protein V7K90_30875 [Nostoc sp.]|uniref:hypothetical protein n=1 Tax=Nostoc sp. TaxID=1180 RepID=UPI002FFB259A